MGRRGPGKVWGGMQAAVGRLLQDRVGGGHCRGAGKSTRQGVRGARAPVRGARRLRCDVKVSSLCHPVQEISRVAAAKGPWASPVRHLWPSKR